MATTETGRTDAGVPPEDGDTHIVKKPRIVTIGGIEIDWGRALTASFWVLVAIFIILPAAQLPYTRSMRKASLYNQSWVVDMKVPPPAQMVELIVICLVWAAALGFGYALYYRDLPGGWFSRGAVLGFGLWAVSMHGEFLALAADLMPGFVHVVIWILLSIPMIIAIGAVVAFVYPKRYRSPPSDRKVLTPAPKRPWSDVWADLWEHRWPVVLATGICFVFSGSLFGLYMLVVNPFKWVPWLYRESVVEGRYSIGPLMYVGAIVLAWCFLYVVFYAIVRRSAPWKGVSRGAFFGLAVYAMFTLPFMLVFFPVNTVPTKFILPTLLVLPLVMFVGMGAIGAGVFELAKKHRRLMSPLGSSPG